MLRVKLAETAGFCFGVNRAVELTYSLIDSGKKVCTLGPLIHNTQVIEDLESKGVSVAESVEDVPGDCTVVIRAHGVEKSVADSLVSTGAEVCDATCPFVKKIHKIVSDNSSREIPVLIAGDGNHPEVKGIIGYCSGDVFTFANAEELEKLFGNYPSLCQKRIIIVSQTTFSEPEWLKCKEKIKNYCTNANIFDTICFATEERQREAARISAEADAMIVVGGRHSSNTEKLRLICSKNCPTFLVERAEELKTIDFSTYAEVGVTAGASTPAAIIKEVLLAMSEIIETTNNQVEEVPSDAMTTDNWFVEDTLSDSNIIKCTVMGITPTEVQVDIPKNHILGGLTGLVSYDEYSNDPNADPSKELKVGDEIDLVIMKKNDADGTVMLSKKRFDAQKSWVDVIEASKDERILEGTVTEIIKGGVLVVTGGVRVFIPASLATERRDQPLEDLLKKTVRFKVIEVNEQRKRAVGSVRAVLRDEKKEASEAFWANVQEGATYHGTVKSLTNFGAFVDIGGVDGMVHISEMSWKRIKHPSEVMNVGDEVDVYIKALDRENKKISLGYRRDEDNPWAILKKDYPVDSVIEAEIVGLTTFGAFARVIPGIDGLIHISQIANTRVEKPQDFLAVGDKVTCKITEIDFDKKRVSLSIRALLEPEEEEAPADEAPAEEVAAEEAPAEE